MMLESQRRKIEMKLNLIKADAGISIEKENILIFIFLVNYEAN
jgi:hypothetical protein